MSFMDRHGQELAPDELDWPNPAEYGTDVPETVDPDTGAPVVVVRFHGTTTVTTAADMCDSMDVSLDQFHDAMAGLVGSGWLTLLEDGTYAASIPEGADL